MDANVYRQLAEIAGGICISECNLNAQEICRGTDGNCSEAGMRRCGKAWLDAGGCDCPDCNPMAVIAAFPKWCLECPDVAEANKAACNISDPETPSPTLAETPSPTLARTPSPTVTETPLPTIGETPSPTGAETPRPTVQEYRCMNWFGNGLDWSKIPFGRYGNTAWGHTPSGCTRSAVSPHGKYHCGRQGLNGITSCDGDCHDGKCTAETPSPTVAETPMPTLATTESPTFWRTARPTLARTASPTVQDETPSPTVAKTPRPTVQDEALAGCVIEGKRFKGRATKTRVKNAVDCFEKCQAMLNTDGGKMCKGWSWVEGQKKPCRLYTKNKNLTASRAAVSGKRNCHPTLGKTRSG